MRMVWIQTVLTNINEKVEIEKGSKYITNLLSSLKKQVTAISEENKPS